MWNRPSREAGKDALSPDVQPCAAVRPREFLRYHQLQVTPCFHVSLSELRQSQKKEEVSLLIEKDCVYCFTFMYTTVTFMTIFLVTVSGMALRVPHVLTGS